ncbi:hypothetical protein BT69DRAFT_1278653 [Atractiella rhizophila]|nr:hypothetical protein BT69DRAFT_1278653 [Atractiella rhizophila]
MLASGVGGFPSEEQRASGLWTGTGASTQSSTPVSRTVVPELQGEDGGAEGPDTYERFERKKF